MSETDHHGNQSAQHPLPAEVSSKPLHAAQTSASGHWCELVSDAIVCLNERWEVLFANGPAIQMFPGEQPLEAGQPAWQWPGLLTVLGELHLDTLKSSSSGQSHFQTMRTAELSKAGASIPLEVSVSISGESGERIFALVFRDVSHQRPAEATLYQSQKQRVIGSLAGGFAHDFNNVLTAVICRLEMGLGSPDLPENARDNLAKALESARRGADLNTKLMAFSRQAKTKPSPQDVVRLVEESVFILRRSVDRGVQIHFVPPAEKLWNALGDPDQLMQVVMNLCLNARDAMSGGGELTIECANRAFGPADAQQPRRAGEFVWLTISDTGHGMTPEVLSRLFEPYFSTKGFGKGAGLGLSIANHIVVEHGGWMEVESQHEEGSRFHVFLPRTTAELPAPVFKEHRALGNNVLKGGETILLVDDESSVRSVMSAALSFRGYKIMEAADGEEALDRYREKSKEIDLILLDLQMPRMNGWETMQKILALNPRARVLLLSGSSPVAPTPSAGDQAVGILMKPFQSVQLLRIIREALDDGKTN